MKNAVVPLAGIEPARPYGHLILSQARLPVPPQGQRRDKTLFGRGASANSPGGRHKGIDPGDQADFQADFQARGPARRNASAWCASLAALCLDGPPAFP
jgi:hypothetical protein